MAAATDENVCRVLPFNWTEYGITILEIRALAQYSLMHLSVFSMFSVFPMMNSMSRCNGIDVSFQ